MWLGSLSVLKIENFEEHNNDTRIRQDDGESRFNLQTANRISANEILWCTTYYENLRILAFKIFTRTLNSFDVYGVVSDFSRQKMKKDHLFVCFAKFNLGALTANYYSYFFASWKPRRSDVWVLPLTTSLLQFGIFPNRYA